MKKFFAILMSLALMLSLAVPAMADNTTPHTITITNEKAGHIYEAYQIFAGDCSTTDDQLVNIAWGKGVNSNALMTALQATTTFASAENAEDVATILAGLSDDSPAVDAFAQIVGQHLAAVAGTSTESQSPYTIDVTGDGYYLIKDKDDSVTGAEDAYTKYMLKVVEDVNVAAKADAPSLEKKIVEGDTLVDANTAEIGETVNYKLTSRVPDMDGYNKYFFVVHDEMSEGLTFDENSVAIKIGNKQLVENTDFVVITSDLKDDCTFEIVLKNFIQYKGDNYKNATIEITYTALVNEDAVIGNLGNPNTVNLQYSNNPNVEYEGENDKPKANEPTGKTPDDTVITYVTKLTINKVGSNNEGALPGAKFQIAGISNNVVVINEKIYVEATDGTYYRLKDGTYTQEEPEESTTEYYDDVSKKYKEVTVVSRESIATPVVTEGWVNKNGVITFTGLGEGTYTITELVAPDGYNLLKESITVKITGTVPKTVTNKDETAEWKYTLSGAVTKDETVAEGGAVSITVENNAGAVLPETGGMGTTIFYAVGGVMVAAAAILLITKKRLSNNA